MKFSIPYLKILIATITFLFISVNIANAEQITEHKWIWLQSLVINDEIQIFEPNGLPLYSGENLIIQDHLWSTKVIFQKNHTNLNVTKLSIIIIDNK